MRRVEAKEIPPTATISNPVTLEGTLIMVGALEKEEGGEALPVDLHPRGEIDPFVIECKTAPFDQFLEGDFTMDMEMPVESFVDGLQAT